jgi:hypothetical protein
VLRGILEDPDDLGRWIGTPDGPICKYPESLHRLDLAEHPEGWLLARVQLFSYGETPAYDVLLGRLKMPPHVDDAHAEEGLTAHCGAARCCDVDPNLLVLAFPRQLLLASLMLPTATNGQ